jgi:GNAT superfamily N-acetyltransferase
MIRGNLENLPAIVMPRGYSVRQFREEDRSLWADIETSVGEFPDKERALARFSVEFGPHLDDMKERCLILTDSSGRGVGTTTAWYNEDFLSGEYGRIHWVAVRPESQGQGLGKALVASALKLMTRWHGKAYLTTQTTSWIAIQMYLDFGFRPFITKVDEEEGWELLRSKIASPLLKEPFLRETGLT